MYSVKTIATVGLALNACATLIFWLAGNPYWMLVNVMSVIAIIFPVWKNTGYYYTYGIILMSLVVPILNGCVFLVDRLVYDLDVEVFAGITLYNYVTAWLQCQQTFITGYMIAIVLDRSYHYTMTSSWMVIFAVMFTMAMSLLCSLFAFAHLLSIDMPVFNEELPVQARNAINRVFMLAPMTYTFATILYAVLIRRYTKGHGKDAFTFTLGGTQ